MKRTPASIVFWVAIFLLAGCDESIPSERLGKHFQFNHGRRFNSGAIVYCSEVINQPYEIELVVIPRFLNSAILYVEKAASNENWIIAKAVNEDSTFSYFIIDQAFELPEVICDTCANELFSHVHGPFDLQQFAQELSRNKISLKF